MEVAAGYEDWRVFCWLVVDLSMGCGVLRLVPRVRVYTSV